jgi:hypothetical protein
LSLSINNVVNNNLSSPSRLVGKKRILINLTKRNIDGELSQVNQYIDYSQICISWIPVKSYYLFFNLLIIFLYLITDDESWLTEDHKKVHLKLKDLIRDGSITFSVPSFNTIYIPSRILSWRIPSGSNVVVNNPNYQVLERQLIKKMFTYCGEDYKRTKRIKSLRGQVRQNFLSSAVVNLCEFFYWYRLKANYRDMEFVNSNVSIAEFHTFYTEYYMLTNNFYEAFKAGINRLYQQKYGQTLL